MTLALLSLTGCFWRKTKQQPQGATPPPPKPAPTIQPAPPPPKIETATPAAAPSPGVLGKLPEVPKPPEAKPVPRRRPKAGAKPVAKEKLPQPDPGSSAAPVAAPKLGEMLTDAQRADLGKQCDEALRRVNAGLAGLGDKRLSQESMDTLERVRAFVRQAEQARGRDPQSALQLAQRAEVLLADVLRSAR